MRILYNILFELNEELNNILDQEFAPMSAGRFSDDVNNWLDEPPAMANKRKDLRDSVERLTQAK